MFEHKAWDWTKANSDIWQTPSEDSYYLLDRWKSKNFRRFLDLGCGLGRHAFQFARAGFYTCAFDLSKEAIDGLKARAKEEQIKMEAEAGDMISLPYENACFDCLLAYHVISHTTTDGIKKIIKEIERVLAPGGEFFISLCSKNSWSYKEANYPQFDENTVIKQEDGPENGIPHFYSDEKTIRELFSAFHIIRLRHIQDILVDGNGGSWHYFLLGNKP